MGGWHRLDHQNRATRIFCALYWWAEVKFRGKSTKIRLDLGPKEANRPKNAQTGGVVLHGQHKKLASNSSLGYGRERF
jgi:hypothetical protein